MDGESTAVKGLNIINLHVSFGAAKVLRGVDLHVGPKGIVGLAGPNGAGKSTLLRAISGLVKRGDGELTFDGSRLSARPGRVARVGISHVPEGRRVSRSLSVRDNLRLGALAVGIKPTDEDLAAVLDVFPALGALVARMGGTLSGGEQQMLAIGRALMARPKLLMIDELSLGLSPRATTEVMEAVVDLNGSSGVTLLLVDQNIRALSAICHSLYLLKNGLSSQDSRENGDAETLFKEAYFD